MNTSELEARLRPDGTAYNLSIVKELQACAHRDNQAMRALAYITDLETDIQTYRATMVRISEAANAEAAALSTLRQRIEALEAENGRLKYAVQDVVRTNTENCRQRDLYQYHLRKAKDRLFNVAEGAVDEGDRAYFRSTNEPADMLEMANALEHLLESDARQALGEG